jgi:hypothetical protein
VKKITLAVAVIALCSFSLAQDPEPAVVRSFGLARNLEAATSREHSEKAALMAQQYAAASLRDFATSTCSFTFSSGSKNTFLKYCVTANGNIAQLETPAGAENIAVGSVGEGYGVCDLQNPASPTAYNDFADFGDSGNWSVTTVLNQDAKSVKLARTTRDGILDVDSDVYSSSGEFAVRKNRYGFEEQYGRHQTSSPASLCGCGCHRSHHQQPRCHPQQRIRMEFHLLEYRTVGIGAARPGYNQLSPLGPRAEHFQPAGHL